MPSFRSVVYGRSIYCAGPLAYGYFLARFSTVSTSLEEDV